MTKIRLYWCDRCNVPRFEKTPCSICKENPRKVEISPPGDPFPAMDGHLARVINTIDDQFGKGIGAQVLPNTKPVVMNKISALDAMYEVIIDGYLIGRLRFEIPKLCYTFLPTLEGARRIGAISRQKWISVHDGAIPFLKKGANLMLPGVAACDSEIARKDEVWLIDSAGFTIGVGTARLSGPEMAQNKKGFAVKIREFGNPSPPLINPQSCSWETVVLANQEDLEKIEEDALKFIRRVAKESESSSVVGFSGGKDSLVTYLLVEKALDKPPPIFFMDTGIEFPETIQYVNEFSEARNIEILGQRAGNRFWESVESFGPPARDFRWCCKILKLGPAAKTISEKLDGSIISFMGQRKLESFARSIEPKVASNPWVPGQTSANPIQNWNALEVWLYIFREKERYNPLYNRGYHRLGCYLCPASPLAEFEELKESHRGLYDKWYEMMHAWAKKLGYPEKWVEFGFWRWKHLPKGQLHLIEKMGVDIDFSRSSPAQELTLKTTKGVSPCISSGFSLEGQFSSGLDLERIAKILSIFGKTTFWEELGALRVVSNRNSITLFSSGAIVIRGKDEDGIEKLAQQVERAIRRSMYCQFCGSCIVQCDNGALFLARDGISVNADKCSNCLKCDTWPCPTYLQ